MSSTNSLNNISNNDKIIDYIDKKIELSMKDYKEGKYSTFEESKKEMDQYCNNLLQSFNN